MAAACVPTPGGRTATARFSRILSTAGHSTLWRAHDLPGAKVKSPPDFCAHLLEHGWAVVPGVLDAAECAAVCAGLALAGADGVQAAWRVRQHPAVVAVFQKLWDTPALLASTEGWLYEPATAAAPTAAAPTAATDDMHVPALFAGAAPHGSWVPPHIAIATGRLAAGEVAVHGLLAAADTDRWCVLDGSHKYAVPCMAAFGVDTGGVDWHALTDAQTAWMQEYVGRDPASDAAAPDAAALTWRPRTTRACVRVSAGSLVLRLASTVCGIAPAPRGATTALVLVSYAPKAWARASDLQAKRVLFAKGATTDAWPLFHTRVLSFAPTPAGWPALTPLGAALVGFDTPPAPAVLATLAAAAVPATAPPSAPVSVSGSGKRDALAPATPARRTAGKLAAVTSPGRAGLVLRKQRTIRVGDAKTRQLVVEAMAEGSTVLRLLEPELVTGSYTGSYTEHDVEESKAALAAAVGIGWFAVMLVADTEDITLGRNALGERIVVRDAAGGVHREIPRAAPGSAADAAATLVARQVAKLPGLAPPRALSALAYANDSVVVEVTAWERAPVEADMATILPHMRAVGVDLVVQEVPLAAEQWTTPPPAVAAIASVTRFLETSPAWKMGAPHMRVTLGTPGAARLLQEGYGDGTHVAVVCEGCMSVVYDALEAQLRADVPVPAGITVHVAWDGKAPQTDAGL